MICLPHAMAVPVLVTATVSGRFLNGGWASPAAKAGQSLLAPHTPVRLVVVSDAPDVGDTVGAGHAGPLVTPEEFERETEAADGIARAILADAAEVLDLGDGPADVLHGSPGPAICAHATDLSAAAIVIGSRGRGGLKRAVLGSVSDHVVRHAPCPVIVTSPPGVVHD